MLGYAPWSINFNRCRAEFVDESLRKIFFFIPRTYIVYLFHPVILLVYFSRSYLTRDSLLLEWIKESRLR